MSTGKFRFTTHKLVTENISSELPMQFPAGPLSAWAEAVEPVRTPVVNANAASAVVIRRMVILLSSSRFPMAGDCPEAGRMNGIAADGTGPGDPHPDPPGGGAAGGAPVG